MPVFKATTPFETSAAVPNDTTQFALVDTSFTTDNLDSIVYHGTSLSAENYVTSTSDFIDTLTTALNSALGTITSSASEQPLKVKIWGYYAAGTSTPSSITIQATGTTNVGAYVNSLKAGEFFNPTNNPSNYTLTNGDTILVPISLSAANGLPAKTIYYGYTIA